MKKRKKYGKEVFSKMFEIKEILEKKLNLAEQGQYEWEYLLQRVQADPNDYFILYPNKDRECNYYGMQYLDIFLERQEGKNAIILTSDEYVEHQIKNFSSRIKVILHYDSQKIKNILSLYELYPFDSRFIVISLDEPYCRNARGIIGVKGTTVEQLIAIGIYKIIPFKPIKKSADLKGYYIQ